jgi:hypothetical protein
MVLDDQDRDGVLGGFGHYGAHSSWAMSAVVSFMMNAFRRLRAPPITFDDLSHIVVETPGLGGHELFADDRDARFWHIFLVSDGQSS